MSRCKMWVQAESSSFINVMVNKIRNKENLISKKKKIVERKEKIINLNNKMKKFQLLN